MINIRPFALERYFARHEFSARYLLSSSDCEALTLSELLAMADGEARHLWENLKLSYTETPGHPLLREAIAAIYTGLTAEDILVAAPEEGIFLAMQALLEPGDHVVCTFPGYQSLYELARSNGCEVSLWTPDEEKGWHFNLDQLDRMIRDNTRLVVANFPHNPTGFVPTVAEYTALVQRVGRSGARFFSDEMYRFLEIDPIPCLPSACELDPGAVSLFGMSKTFGLPGLRIGLLATRDRDLLDRISRLKDYTTICSSAPSEILALMALRSREAIIDRQKKRLHRNLSVLDQFMDRYSDRFAWHRPRGGSVCLPRMLEANDTFVFCETLVETAGIMLVPSRLFDFGDCHVRFGFGRENFPAVLDRFADYLDRS